MTENLNILRKRRGLSVAVRFLNEDEGQNIGKETDFILKRQLLHLRGKEGVFCVMASLLYRTAAWDNWKWLKVKAQGEGAKSEIVMKECDSKLASQIEGLPGSAEVI